MNVLILKQLVGKYPELKLFFVGDGPDRNVPEEETRRLMLRERVIFAGAQKDVERMKTWKTDRC